MRKGQILLIIVMMLATVLTIVLAVTFKSTNDLKTTKIEQDSQRALAAAEAALESALQSNREVIIGQDNQLSSFTGMTGNATVEDLITNTFTTSTIVKDGSYTFYIANYDPATKKFTGSSTSEPVTVCFQSASVNPAIEITLIKNDSVRKYVVDPDHRITNTLIDAGTCFPNTDYKHSFVIPGSDISTDTKIILVRVLYNASKLIFYRTTDFPIQGRTAFSTVVTSTGVSKKVSLFQSYPQIPAEFYVTSFGPITTPAP